MGITHEKIENLIGVVDGLNTTFTTPSPFVSGTLKVIVNGLVYDSSDDYFGWTEVNEEEITMLNAPLTGYVLQAFYQEAEPQGSPFHPSEL